MNSAKQQMSTRAHTKPVQSIQKKVGLGPITIPPPSMTYGTTGSDQQGKTAHPNECVEAPAIHPAPLYFSGSAGLIRFQIVFLADTKACKPPGDLNKETYQKQPREG